MPESHYDCDGIPRRPSMNTPVAHAPAPDSTGIAGLDEILRGGLTPHRVYLVEGVPGSGKTTLALQFLLEGARRGEPVLYVTLSETEAELQGVAESHGWSLDGIDIRELAPPEESLRPDDQYTMFHPVRGRAAETTKTILARRRAPEARAASCSIRCPRCGSSPAIPLRYRRQILALKQFFVGRSCTVLLLDDLTSAGHDLQVQSIAHGVMRARAAAPRIRRRAAAPARAQVSRRCDSAAAITTTSSARAASVVFPRLVAARAPRDAPTERLSSGVAGDRRPARRRPRARHEHADPRRRRHRASRRSRRSSRSPAAARGEHAAMFIFDESLRNARSRACDGLGMRLRRTSRRDGSRIQQVDPAEMSPGRVRARDHDVRRGAAAPGSS